MSEERIQVWHFIRADHTTGEGRLKVEVGQVLSVKGTLKLCEHGLHGSRKALDALYYAPGPVACKDEIWGDIIEDNDKLCGRYRKCLAMIDATYILHEFGCRCPERALTRRREAGMEPDPRSWAAIDAKRKWLRGEIDDAKLAAAWAAARDAAWDATRAGAGDAARAAAWAAAGDAVWNAAWAAAGAAALAAARAAARAAAGAATRDAAWAAARDIAWDAARTAAWDAERDWQNAKLEEMLNDLLKEGEGK